MYIEKNTNMKSFWGYTLLMTFKRVIIVLWKWSIPIFICSHCCHMTPWRSAVQVFPNPNFYSRIGLLFHCCSGLFFNFVCWSEPTNAIFTPHPPDLNWVSCGLVLRRNMADFLVKTWQPWPYRSFAHVGYFRTMICLHWKSDIGHI